MTTTEDPNPTPAGPDTGQPDEVALSFEGLWLGQMMVTCSVGRVAESLASMRTSGEDLPAAERAFLDSLRRAVERYAHDRRQRDLPAPVTLPPASPPAS